MHRMNDTEIVKKQYATASNLSTRISIHDKYSTNKTGFGNWIFSNYRITPGAKVLELGCGTGDMWKTRSDSIERCSKFVLSAYGVKDTVNKNFTLQNGQEILSKVFSNVQKLNYEDALAVTDINDMVDYIYSMTSMTVLHTVPKPIIAEALSAHIENGILYVPKEYGMFVCS